MVQPISSYTEVTSPHPINEVDHDKISTLFGEDKSILEIGVESAKMIREFSPILLGDEPFSPSDNFFVKCIKYATASIKVLFFMTDDIKTALMAYQLYNNFFHIAIQDPEAISKSQSILMEEV
ncbi:MAG: hypothetical protein KDK96_01055 [Chlamydiia bacterium]|nr:hypothetical protein [Chlamydiia bacterium]